jgi:hypothetical protein
MGMRRLIATGLMVVTSSGLGVALSSTGAHAAALDCVQLTNPAVNQVVQAACETVDPHGG